MFLKYHSIENSYRKTTTNFLHEFGLTTPDKKYVVLEKAHGANFSIISDGRNEMCAKRSGILGNAGNFFRFQRPYSKIQYSVLGNFKKICELSKEKNLLLNEDVATVHFFGELIGGRYKHPDVENIPSVKNVQNGIMYAPDIEIVFFDIMVAGEKKDIGMHKVAHLNRHDFVHIMESMPGANYLPTLFAGTFDECLLFSREHKEDITEIPHIFGLPDIDGNIREGHIIKSHETLYIPGRDRNIRSILKDKNEKFSERKPKERKPIEPLSGEVLAVVSRCDELINENRLRNVISHIGNIEQKDFGVVLRALNSDVLGEMGKDDEEFKMLGKGDLRSVTKHVNVNCASLIRQNFLNIIDGEF